MKTALPVALTARLNLKPKDIAEIGGFSLRFAQALAAGKVAFPSDVVTALEQIDGDLHTMTKDILGDLTPQQEAFNIFRTNEELREHCRKQHPYWMARGQSNGPFVGPHRVATYYAWRVLKKQHMGWRDIVFHP